MATPLVPFELIYKISRHLSRTDDVGAIKSASLTSSVLREVFQGLLFSEVTVYKLREGQNDSAHHLSGLEILRRNPNLLKFVKIVTIDHSKGYAGRDDSPIEECMVGLIQLLSTSPLQELNLYGWFDCGKSSPSFQEAVFNLIRSPTLKSLIIYDAPPELSGLVESPSFESLVHHELGVGALNHQLFRPPFPTRSQTIRPGCISISATKATIDYLTKESSGIDLRCTKSLNLYAGYAPAGDVALLVARCANSLRKLRISTKHLDPLIGSSLSPLGQLCDLYHLEVNAEGCFRMKDLPIEGLSRLLDLLPSPSSVTTITFDQVPCIDARRFIEGAEIWNQVDDMLSKPGSFPRLRVIGFRVWFDQECSPTANVWEHGQSKYWQACRGTGVVVDFEDMLMNR